MAEDPLDPELEKLFKQVKLKEPPVQAASNYLAGVECKIARIQRAPLVGILLAGVVLAAGFAAVEFTQYFGPGRETTELQSARVIPAPAAPFGGKAGIKNAGAPFMAPDLRGRDESRPYFELEVLEAIDAELEDEILFDLLEGDDLTNEFLFMEQLEAGSVA